jgi:glycine/D-amino acid oxidase-like deaminating enzyme
MPTFAQPTNPVIPPLRAALDRLHKITVCTRPFRATGPRIEPERIGEKLVIHNYGHGGSGWSLSWGSGEVALELALAGRDPSATDIAVIGCGAMGLTAAIVAQRAGARSVTIYAKASPTESRSFNATGSWTPFSRVALRGSATPAFGDLWEKMTRTSWSTYQGFLQQPSQAIEFTDRYYLSDVHPDLAEQQKYDSDPIGFVHYENRIADLTAAPEDMPEGTHPFPTRWARRRSELMFNITAYSHQLTEEFQRNGGRLVVREFHSPAEFASLPQPVIVHSTGYAARSLFGDESLTPVRGQIGWLIPQVESLHGLYFDNLGVLSRRDGIVVQLNAQGEATGWNDASETPDRNEAETGVRMLQSLYARMGL